MKTKNTLIVFCVAATLLTQTGFAQSGSVDTTFMHRVGPDGPVNAAVAQTDGKVVFGGAFANVNLAPLNGLGRADTNGEVDASFAIGSGPDAAVNALALQDDGRILVAGAFTNFSGALRPGLARLNSDGSLDTNFLTGTGADGPVNFVAWQTNGQVLIQGVFSNYNGAPRLGLARLNADGSLDAGFDPGGRAASVTALAWQGDGKVVFSGNFTNLDGIGATNLARLNADGSLDTNFCAVASLDKPALSVVVQPDGRLLLSGPLFLTNFNGVARGGVVRLNADGTPDTSFNPGTGFAGRAGTHGWLGQVYLALQPDGNILAWGTFTSFNGVTRSGAARLASSGDLDPTFDPAWAAGTSVKSVAFLADGRFVTGGSGFLTRRNPDGTREATWMNETGTDGQVHCVIRQTDGKVVLGGQFSRANAVARTNLARLNADGSLDTGFTANTPQWSSGEDESQILALTVQPDGKLLVGGSFTNLSGVNCTNLARLNPDGSLDATFVANLWGPDYSEVAAVAVQPDGKLLVGGLFAQINGVAVTNVARLNPDGSVDATFNAGAGPDDEVYAFALQPDGMILIGGCFQQVNGIHQAALARLRPNGQFDPSLAASLDSTVYALGIQTDGRILVGGDFYRVNGVTQAKLARLNPDGSVDTAFAPVLNVTVFSLLLQPDGRTLIGGAFASDGLARLNANGTPDTTFNPGSGAATVYCLALQPDGRVLVGGDFSQFNGIPRGGIVRLTNDVGAPLQVPAAITIQPPPYVTAWSGSNAMFGVSAAGTLPLSFQWLFNGTNLPGQTNGFCQLANLSASAAGLYTLIVSNAFGAVTSAPVRLEVLPATARPGSVDMRFQAQTRLGPDAPVEWMVEQPDGKLLVCGDYSHFNGALHRGIVRLNPDGSLDTSFNANAGVNDGEVVFAVRPQPDGKILVDGMFAHLNGALRSNLARLNEDGTLDTNFTASLDAEGWGSPLALQPDGKIIVGGWFESVDDVPINHLARLNPDGSLDSSFDPGTGPDDSTVTILLQPDGKIVVGGDFTKFNGVTANHLARLNADGSLDASFNQCQGVTDSFGAIDILALQPDHKILVGGWFSAFNGVARTNLARINPDGSLDNTFVPAPLAWQNLGGQVWGLALQPDGKVVIGFYPTNTAAGGHCVARLNPDGSLDPSFQIGSCSAGGIYCMTRLASGQIMLGGDFADFNGVATPFLARLRGDEASVILPFSLGLRWNVGQLELGLFGEAGRVYAIDAATNLPQFSPWTNVTSTGTNWLSVPALPPQPQQFFRARTSN